MAPRAVPALILTALVAVTLGGCIAAPREPSDARADAMSRAAADSALRWSKHLTTTLTFGAAAAVPFERVAHLTTDGDLVTFWMPRNVTRIHVDLNASFANASRAGVGYATFLVQHGNETDTPDGEYVTALSPYAPALEPMPRDRSHLSIRDPRPGPWSVWVWPKGATLNQAFELTLRVEGYGCAPLALPLLVAPASAAPRGSGAPGASA